IQNCQLPWEEPSFIVCLAVCRTVIREHIAKENGNAMTEGASILPRRLLKRRGAGCYSCHRPRRAAR
ncbi:MAG: hypothetical protein QGI13_00005, partial [Rhodospirillales bacterium]|nr:hypothetical protein [Rhodospirillales bacterium]